MAQAERFLTLPDLEGVLSKHCQLDRDILACCRRVRFRIPHGCHNPIGNLREPFLFADKVCANPDFL
jgi:hypothetical protein